MPTQPPKIRVAYLAIVGVYPLSSGAAGGKSGAMSMGYTEDGTRPQLQGEVSMTSGTRQITVIAQEKTRPKPIAENAILARICQKCACVA